MSRLHTRIEELERSLGDCRSCKTPIELVYPDRPKTEATVVDCPVCGETQERIAVLVAFDPSGG